MKLKASYIQHPSALGGGEGDLILKGVLVEDDVKITEQLWANQLDANNAVLLSIPFFLYGYCYMDLIEFDDEFIMGRLVRQGGYSGFRIIASSRDRLEAIGNSCQKFGAVLEFYSDTMLALAVENGSAQESTLKCLQELVDRGEISFDTVY